MKATQRKNLLRLAEYLETLPRNYRHFDMQNYTEHLGECELPMPESLYAAKMPDAFLANCGTAACAVGHGPAAGILPLKKEFGARTFDWISYCDRAFSDDPDAFEFMFGGGWNIPDNHHYGAAARIRYFLACGLPDDFDEPGRSFKPLYAPYRKGSRSAKRREIEMAAA